jgi:hypothetical protein
VLDKLYHQDTVGRNGKTVKIWRLKGRVVLAMLNSRAISELAVNSTNHSILSFSLCLQGCI